MYCMLQNIASDMKFDKYLVRTKQILLRHKTIHQNQLNANIFRESQWLDENELLVFTQTPEVFYVKIDLIL